MTHEHDSTNPQGVRGAPQGALESAIALLRRSVCVDEGEAGGRQWRVLETWARSCGLILPSSFRPAEPGGREHDVLKPEGERVWYKFTKPWCSGYTVEVIDGKPYMMPATPLQYLERWAIGNDLFRDSVKLVGIAKDESGCRLVVSQPDIVGPRPSREDVDTLFASIYGMRRLPKSLWLGGYESRGYFAGRLGIFDVRPHNCVRDEATGEIAPIDIIPRFYSRSDAIEMKRLAL